MRTSRMSFAAFAATLGAALALAPQSAQADRGRLDTAKIESVTGLKGDFIKNEGVYRLSIPRDDLQVTISGVKAVAPLAAQSRVNFTRIANTTLARGELILTEGQVDKVLSAVLDSGLQVTALNNRYLGDNPKLMELQVIGADTEEKLAGATKKVLDAIKDSANDQLPNVEFDTANSTLNSKSISDSIGLQGDSKDNILEFTVPKVIRFGRFTVSPGMGAQSDLKFAGTDEKAVATGEIAATASELQSVLKGLRDAKIRVLAIHNHMLIENPRLVFVSYMGVGAAQDLAKGLKAALPKQAQPRHPAPLRR